MGEAAITKTKYNKLQQKKAREKKKVLRKSTIKDEKIEAKIKKKLG